MSQKLNVPEGISYPFCDSVITNATAVADARQPGFRKGAFTVCVRCGNPSVMGDEGLRKIKQSEFEALDLPTKSAITATVNAVKKIMGAGRG